MTFQCQKCGFVFERHSEPSACPQCSGEFILPVSSADDGTKDTEADSKTTEQES